MHVTRLALALILALGARSAVGIPLSTVAELRAVSCCASPACVNVLRASQCSCCQVANADDVALKQVLPSGQQHGAIGLPGRATIVPCPGRITSFGPVTADATEPPTYLRLLTLQC